jgi:hypothetical protein
MNDNSSKKHLVKLADKKDNLLALVKKEKDKLSEWIKKRPRNAVIAVTSTALSVVGLVLLIKFVLPLLALLGFFYWVFADGHLKIPQVQTFDNTEICDIVTRHIFQMIHSIKDSISDFCAIPKLVTGLYDPNNFRVLYNSVPMLRLRVLSKNRQIDEDNCEYLKQALQRAVDTGCEAGFLRGYNWAVKAAPDLPLLKIATVEIVGRDIVIGILLVNTALSAEAARKSDDIVVTSIPNDSDPLF